MKDPVPARAAAPRASPAARVRRARATDAATWWSLQRGIYDEGAWFVGDGPPSEGSLAARLRSLDQTRSGVWFAVVGDQVAGWCEVSRFAAVRLDHVAVLTLAVAAPYRRRGCGEAMLVAAEEWARRVGVRKLSLSVRGGNEAAQALYERSGFVLEGVERGHIRTGATFEDNRIMAKHLVEGA
jgi:ribosomal protein S18 acetylase RimI-like enzyme